MPFDKLQNEESRLRKLIEYEIFDTEPESAIDDLTKLAALLCDAPISLVTIVGADRLWFKSRYGLDAGEIPRDDFFCAHTVLSSKDILIVENAAEDERFREHPMVTGAPHVRFYAGAPLVSPDGIVLGALCLIDRQPRTLTAEQTAALKLLAGQVVGQFETRRVMRENDLLAQQCHLALSEAADGIHLFSADGTIIAVNPKFCEITGRTETQLLGMKVFELVPPEELVDTPKHFAELFAGKSILVEQNIMRPDGSVLPVEISSRQIAENTFQSIVRDISERRETARRLRETEQKFSDFLNSSLAFFCTHDLEGTVFSVSPAAAGALGYTESELVGGSLSKILLPAARKILPDYLKQLTVEGKSRGLMYVATKSGERRIWSYNNIVREDSAGVRYVIGSSQDVTDLKRGEDALRKSQNLFRSFIDNSPAVIFLKNDRGSYELINRSFENLFGVTIADLEGKSDYDLFPEEVADIVRANDLKVLETEQTMKAEEFVPTPDGTTQYWISHKFPVTDEAGNKFVGGISININERKQMEDELKAACDAALESARLKSAFLSNVSHEIRTPMNGVIGITELLLDTPLDDAQREYAEMIRQSGDALLTVINDILDLSKIEAGKLRFEAFDFDLRETVESTVEMMAERAFRKNLEIASLIEGDVPDLVSGDAGRLRQVLTNLISNAVKYTEEGEIGIVVKLEKETARRVLLKFTVTDTGIGIAGEDIRNLFQPFVQVDNSTTRKFGGTGLGLAISKQIVELMSGEIAVESEPGRGSEFSFTAWFETAKHTAKKTTTDLSALLRGRKILVADARRITRDVLSNYIRLWNLQVETASSGEEAFEKLQAAKDCGAPFDAAVIDMNLPDCEGFALAWRIASEPALNQTSVILTTAYGQRGDAAQAQKLGVSAYLTKPIRGAQLYDCLIALFRDRDRTDSSVQDYEKATLVTRHSLREAKTRAASVPLFTSENAPRLLVVEDAETNRRLLAKQFEQIGLTADFAVDGADALEKIADADYQVILMDCQMPRLDGYETTREIRRREHEKFAQGKSFKQVSIIALTAHTLAGEREKCLAAGMDDYLSKPARIKNLATAIRFWSALSGETDPANLSDETVLTKIPPVAGNDEITELFISETAHHIEQIQRAFNSGDLNAVVRLAHSVRGNSLALGANILAEKIESVEKAAKSHADEAARQAFNSFSDEFTIFKSSLKQVNTQHSDFREF